MSYNLLLESQFLLFLVLFELLLEGNLLAQFIWKWIFNDLSVNIFINVRLRKGSVKVGGEIILRIIGLEGVKIWELVSEERMVRVRVSFLWGLFGEVFGVVLSGISKEVLEEFLLIEFELDFVGGDSDFGEEVLGDLHEHKNKIKQVWMFITSNYMNL